MEGEPIDLAWIFGIKPIQRWLHYGVAPWDLLYISIGVLPDGRWYSHTTARAQPVTAWAWPDEHAARQHLANLLAVRGDGWIEIPAAYDARGRPLGDGPWTLVGTQWRRTPP